MAKRKVLETGVVNLGKWGHKELWDYEIFEDEQGQKRKYIMRPGSTLEVDPKTNEIEDIVYFESARRFFSKAKKELNPWWRKKTPRHLQKSGKGKC
jgi:hypothetical protein